MNPRNGKIARLPRAVRQELNERLQNEEQGEALLAWLNAVPAVKAMVEKEFAGVAITKQNLSEWRNGGFVEWAFEAETVGDAGAMEAHAAALGRATQGRLADQLATVLAGRYASLLRHWDGTVTDEFRAKLKVLRGMTLDIAQLRRWDHSAGRLRMETENHEAEREKTEAEVVAHFEEWIKNPAVHDWIVATWVPKKERIRRRQEMFGLNEEEQAQEEKKAARRARKATKQAATSKEDGKSQPAGDLDRPKPEDTGNDGPAHGEAGSHEDSKKQNPTCGEIPGSQAQDESHPVAVNRTDFPGGEANGVPTEKPGAGGVPGVKNQTEGPNETPCGRENIKQHDPTQGEERKSSGEGVEMASGETPVASPCVGICRRNGGGYCASCGRSVAEVVRWAQMPDAEKRQVLEQVALRRARWKSTAENRN